jgi:hypothetical protein
MINNLELVLFVLPSIYTPEDVINAETYWSNEELKPLLRNCVVIDCIVL